MKKKEIEKARSQLEEGRDGVDFKVCYVFSLKSYVKLELPHPLDASI